MAASAMLMEETFFLLRALIDLAGVPFSSILGPAAAFFGESLLAACSLTLTML